MTPEPLPEQPDETPRVAMRHYVVCYDTADYPGVYAVRKHLVFAGRSRPAELLGVRADLAAARRLVPAGAVRLAPSPGDDPVIVEVWLE